MNFDIQDGSVGSLKTPFNHIRPSNKLKTIRGNVYGYKNDGPFLVWLNYGIPFQLPLHLVLHNCILIRTLANEGWLASAAVLTDKRPRRSRPSVKGRHALVRALISRLNYCAVRRTRPNGGNCDGGKGELCRLL